MAESMTLKELETEALCPHCQTRLRSDKEKKGLINRLKRIEGQIRGICGMLEKDAYCVDILNQAAAAGSGLDSFSRVLLEAHIRTCVADDLKEGKQDKIDELMKILQKLM